MATDKKDYAPVAEPATSSPEPLWFDLEAMKRRFGAPPLFGRTNTVEFDTFILSLAECMEAGDAIVAIYVYQYGLEQYKMMMLLNWQSEALGQIPAFKARHDAILSEATQQRDTALKDKEIHRQRIRPANNALTEATFFNDAIYQQVRFADKSSLRELRVAEDAEHRLLNYARVDRLINECSKRAKQALARAQAHSGRLAERLANERMEAAIEAVQYGGPVPEGLKDVNSCK